MLRRTPGSVVLAVSVFAILGTGSPWGSAVAQVEPGEPALRFEEIESVARTRSPRLRAIEQRRSMAEAGVDAESAWSSPALGYDREQADSHAEWQITLGKRFESPLAQSNARRARQARMEAARWQAENETRTVLGELKAGYVRIQILDAHIDRLERLSGLVDLASGIARDRHAEGELSGVEKDLVQLAQFSVDAARRRVRLAHRLEFAAWRAEMGLEEGRGSRLSTPTGFQAFELADVAAYVPMLAEHPSTLARSARARALQQESAAAGPTLLPALEFYAGYRRFDPDLDGIVAGLSMDMPFLGRRGARSRELVAEGVILEHESGLALARSREEITALVEMVEDAMPALDRFTSRLQESGDLADTLLLAFREGQLTLDAFLGAVQVELAALEDYYDQTAVYYENLFRIEAMTGATIVHFGS